MNDLEKTIACFEHLFESNLLCNYETLTTLSDRLPSVYEKDYQDEWLNLTLPKGVDRLFYFNFLIDFITDLDVENSDKLRSYVKQVEWAISNMLDEKSIIQHEIDRLEQRIEWNRQTLNAYEKELANYQDKLNALNKETEND